MSQKTEYESSSNPESPVPISRRNLLVGSLAVATAVASTNSLASKDHSHAHHHHAVKNTALIQSANECVETGELCLDHCLQMFKQGDTTLAKCAELVNELVIMSTALAKMAIYSSPRLPELAKVCIGVCEACEKECRRHEKHKECKACADACLSCIKECKKIV